MRLIDADVLTRKCEKWLKQDTPDEENMVPLADIAVSMIMEIKEQPTVYDLDGLLDCLEEELVLADKEKERCTKENFSQFDTAKGYANGIANAIDFVKGHIL